VKQPGQSHIVGIVLTPVSGAVNTLNRVGSFDILVEFGEEASREGSGLAAEEDMEDAKDEELFDGLEAGDPNEEFHLFWEWDLLSRAFLGNDRPLFECDADTHECERVKFDYSQSSS
jgi:hypothetical protein